MATVVTDYLDEAAKNFPDKIAFSDKNRRISFFDLRKEALQVAREIIRKGIVKQPIAIFLDKSVECIAAFLGVAYSGNFYTPIDTKMPLLRIQKIIEQLQPPMIITKKEFASDAKKAFDGIASIIYDELPMLSQDMYDDINLPAVIDADVLYVLFTSGSTGVPKGVIISHKSVIDYTEWLANTFNFDANTIFGNQAPFYFDNSVLDIYSTLRAGATCVIIPEEKFSFPIKLLEYMQEHNINTIFWVPSALCLVVNLKALNKRHVDCLEKILFCGEVMPNRHLNHWRREYPNATFANLYGPTEVTDVCSAYVVDRNFTDDEPLPIGKACHNTDIFVLDENNKLVSESRTKGELCVRGVSLAYGYYNAPDKTKAVFVQNPLQNAYPEIIYRTGDIVEYNELGELMYICRKDLQIKHMGHRIELGEIETAVSSLDNVQQNCCAYDEKRGRIVMFYVGDIEENEIRELLGNLLPAYMIPSQICRLDTMPLNLNGKIDRVELKRRL